MVWNWKKFHFLVRDRIVLGHTISRNVLEVNKVKGEVTKKFPPPITVKVVRSFLDLLDFTKDSSRTFLGLKCPLLHTG